MPIYGRIVKGHSLLLAFTDMKFAIFSAIQRGGIMRAGVCNLITARSIAAPRGKAVALRRRGSRCYGSYRNEKHYSHINLTSKFTA